MYGKASRIYTEREKDSLFVKTHVIELAGLLPGNCYYFVVNGTDQSGNSAESSEYNIYHFRSIKSLRHRHTLKFISFNIRHAQRHNHCHQTLHLPLEGTGGHAEYVRIWGNGMDVNATWKGYAGDWHNITFDKTVVLLSNKTYNFGVYPYHIHTHLQHISCYPLY